MTDVSDVVKTLERLPHLRDLAAACLHGATQATAPADRWQRAAGYLAEAAAVIETAQRQLAAVEKREAYCTACGVPVLSQMAGWRHWDGTRSYPGDHEPVIEWRPIEEN